MSSPFRSEHGNIYLELTEEFNTGGFRAIICSGQAVVLHKLAIMSKDGDWIVREDADSLDHVRGVLGRRGASYRFGAPLDVRWMAGGWSAHFEFPGTFRVRADFFTRPPRLSESDIERIWKDQANRRPPFLDPAELAQMKKTNREKDYVVIGELSRIMEDPDDQLLFSRSARDLIKLASAHPERVKALARVRPLLSEISRGEDEIGRLLDEERRYLIRENEKRLERYSKASEQWRAQWPELDRRVSRIPLADAHNIIVEAALKLLPFAPSPLPHE